MSNPVIDQTLAQLRTWADALDGDGKHELGADDLRALATIMEGQQLRIDELVVLSGQAVLLAQMARTFGLNEIMLPGGEAIKQFIRDYIDQGKWDAPIPWPPEDMTSLTRFLRDRGYANINGFIDRPVATQGE